MGEFNERKRAATTISTGSPSAIVDGPKRRSDAPFFLVMGGISGSFILLILLLVAADVMFTSPGEFKAALQKPEIQAAFRLTIVSCTVAAILSVWIGTPLGYLLSRYKFPGRWLVDTIVDIPIVLPPLVLGLSLLILPSRCCMLQPWQVLTGGPAQVRAG